MKSVDSQILHTPAATTFLWNIVVSEDSRLKVGLATSLYDAENIAFTFLDETRATFLSWCDYHARPVDKEAFFDFIEMSKSDFEQVHIELMEIPVPEFLAGKVLSTNVIELPASAGDYEEFGIADGNAYPESSAPPPCGPNVIAFPAPRDPEDLSLDRAIEHFFDARRSEDERDEAMQLIVDLAICRGGTPVGRRAAELASRWFYSEHCE